MKALRKPLVLALLLMIMFSFCLITTLPVRAQVGGGVYYVNAAVGKDTYSPGQAKNLATPWKTIQHAVNTVPAGSTIIVAPGTYVEGIAVRVADLTIRAEFIGTVGIDVSTIDGVWAAVCIFADGVVFDGFVVIGSCLFNPNVSTTRWGVYLANVTGCIVSNNTIVDMSVGGWIGAGILLDASNSNTVISNTCINNQGDGICLYYSDSNVIANNICEHNGFNGVVLSVYSCNNRVENNICIHNQGMGIAVARCSNNNIIAANVASRNSTAGVYIQDAASNNIVSTNELIGNGCGVLVFDEGWGDPESNVIHFNNISGNTGTVWFGEGIVSGLHNSATVDAVVDALYNYWGHPSGPGGVGPGLGDNVSSNVEYIPWITKPFQTVLDEQIGYYGFAVPLKKGWNTLSTPILLENDSWENISQYISYRIAYWFDSSIQEWKPVVSGYRLAPLAAICVYANSDDNLPLMISGGISNPPTRHLNAGWNLIGPTMEFGEDEMAMDRIFWSVGSTPAGLLGYTVVVSPPLVSQVPWVYSRGDIVTTHKMMLYGRGYWIYMENPDILVGFSTTPLSVL